MAELQIRRFQTRVLKSDGTGRQVPASGSPFQAYRQGATASADVQILPLHTVRVEVYDTGRIHVDDQLLLNGDASKMLGVVDIDSNGTWMDLENQSVATINVLRGDRLVLMSNPPTLWLDAHGTTEFMTRTLDANGATAFHCAEERFDLAFSNVPSAPPFMADVPGGWARGDVSWVNAKDYATIQEAIDAVPSGGGTVFLPAGGYWPTSRPAFNPPLVLPHDRPIRLLGEGPFLTTLQYNTIFAEPQQYDPSLDFIHLQGDYQCVEGLTLVGDGIPGSGVGIRIRRTPASGQDEIVFGASVRNCKISFTPSWGIMVDTTPVGGHARFAIWTCYHNLEISDNNQSGAVLLGGAGTTLQFFRDCYFTRFKGCGVKSDGAQGVSLTDCGFDREAGVTFISLNNSSNALIKHCWLEGAWPPPTPPATEPLPCIEALGTYDGLGIENCRFVQNNAQAELYAIHVGGTGRSVVMSGIDVFWVGSVLEVPPHHHVVFEAECEVVIVGGSVSDASGLRSPDHGHLRIDDRSGRTAALNGMWRVRLPRLSQNDRDALTTRSPGDMIFNTTASKAQVFDGSNWKNLW